MLKYIKIHKSTPTGFDLNRWWSVKIETYRSTFMYFYVF